MPILRHIGITYIRDMTPLKTARTSKGLTQEALAARVDVSQAHLSSVENMNERASPELAEKLVKVLGRKLITEEQVLYPKRFLGKAKRKAA